MPPRPPEPGAAGPPCRNPHRLSYPLAVDVVRVTSADRKFTAILAIDKKSQLLVESRYPGPAGDTVDRFADYRMVDGVQIAHRRQSQGAGEKSDLTITQVVLDGAVPDSVFDRPAAP